MKINTSDYIVEKIRNACYHCTTNFQNPISVEERVVVFSNGNLISATDIHIPNIEIISCMHSYGGLQSHLAIILSGTYACTNN
ncbi:unnamed protein product [Acanthoscelides obtectus]|uniref:Uncharacterized protein n=1 Tax=Acanthoscelides obtectus TaxID=200917 RepID=A0A9P0NQ38_ACAOB|nr:unnamed protein product [Acanthoscelides obtectus]CAK1639913.1 hypothetical protein AOBTE_LOCUS11447 [Acanthoscelides obtectus]